MISDSPPALDSTIQQTLSRESRLAALQASDLLDSPPEAIFDRLTRLASNLLETPVSFLALVEEDRDFYKSHAGFGEPLASTRELRGRTFCHHTVASGAPVAISNTLLDPVFREVPSVSSLGVRAYLGVPIRVRAEVIGSLCAIDFEPREWTDRQRAILVELADAATREIALRMALARARTEAREKERMLAHIVHDLRNPLSSVLLRAANLQMDLTGEDQQAANDIVDAARRMGTIIAGLLEPSDSLRLDLVSAEQLVHDAVAMLEPLAAAAGVCLRHASAVGQDQVRVDYSKALRIFSNLVGNSIKFSSRGDTVTVCAHRRGESVRFDVRDEGPGLTKPQVEAVFVEGWRLDPDDPSGRGMGLAIAKRLVEEHGGTIGVESVLGEGSTFYFELPAVPGALDPTRPGSG